MARYECAQVKDIQVTFSPILQTCSCPPGKVDTDATLHACAFLSPFPLSEAHQHFLGTGELRATASAQTNIARLGMVMPGISRHPRNVELDGRRSGKCRACRTPEIAGGACSGGKLVDGPGGSARKNERAPITGTMLPTPEIPGVEELGELVVPQPTATAQRPASRRRLRYGAKKPVSA